MRRHLSVLEPARSSLLCADNRIGNPLFWHFIVRHDSEPDTYVFLSQSADCPPQSLKWPDFYSTRRSFTYKLTMQQRSPEGCLPSFPTILVCPFAFRLTSGVARLRKVIHSRFSFNYSRARYYLYRAFAYTAGDAYGT